MKKLFIYIPFTKYTNNVNIVCSSEKVIDTLKSENVALADNVSFLKKIIPEKYSNKEISIRVYLDSKGSSVLTKIKYPIVLSKYIKNHAAIIAEKLNSVFAEVLRKLLLKEIYMNDEE